MGAPAVVHADEAGGGSDFAGEAEELESLPLSLFDGSDSDVEVVLEERQDPEAVAVALSSGPAGSNDVDMALGQAVAAPVAEDDAQLKALGQANAALVAEDVADAANDNAQQAPAAGSRIRREETFTWRTVSQAHRVQSVECTRINTVISLH